MLQFALENLKVRHIIICGHYGCGGIRAAMDGKRRGLIDHWLQPVTNLATQKQKALSCVADPETRVNIMCEENVRAQVLSVVTNPFVKDAWKRGQELSVHGWIYSIRDGLLRDLETSISKPREALELLKKTQMQKS